MVLAGLALSTACEGRSSKSRPPSYPPMGFDPWARFSTNTNESIFDNAMQSMASNGLLRAGYDRLNLDDAWSLPQRNDTGSMVWDPAKFPSGLPLLARRMKNDGFHPGIYINAGNLSCGGYPGSLDREYLDLNQFVAWGFHYLKVDGCNLPDATVDMYRRVYNQWRWVIEDVMTPRSNETEKQDVNDFWKPDVNDVWKPGTSDYWRPGTNDPKRPAKNDLWRPKPDDDKNNAKIPEHGIVLSNSGPVYFSGKENLTDWYLALDWASRYTQLSRHSADIVTCPGGNGWESIMYNYYQNVRLALFRNRGHINDPDFLIPDHPSLSLEEKKTQFALWCSMSSPLIISADIPALSDEVIGFLTNERFIAVNQHRPETQATLVSHNSTWDILTKTLGSHERLVTILNRGDSVASLNVTWDRLGISWKHTGSGKITSTNLWTGNVTKVWAVYEHELVVKDVPAHGTAVYRVKSASYITPTGLIFNSNSFKCLTDNESDWIRWAECDGSDAQTWVFGRPNGKQSGNIHSMLRPKHCIVDQKGRVSSLLDSCKGEPWTYTSDGLLRSHVPGKCLTEARNGSAITDYCGYFRNDQVLSVPDGVHRSEV
ncbi:Aldolase-type TIM barrel [Metarhizium rileyi]|uniref:Alpha-galactosidase n=1 Tax=Metarhizium rileyi (strain RCEF 4871) TaxID=1649241 RepID=A0A167K9W5_METRR|nr:Aldolase-type TIM barrel [Metarhizium rileyi RCEF 4871]